MVDVLKRGLSLLDCHFFVFFDFHLALLLSSRCVRFDVCSVFSFYRLFVRSFVRSLCHCCQISNACSICLIPVDEFAEIINLCWVQCTLIWKHLSNSFKLKYIMERNHWRNFIRSWIMTNWLANNRSHFGKIVLEFLNGRTDNMRRR